jgi:hypothetical protein
VIIYVGLLSLEVQLGLRKLHSTFSIENTEINPMTHCTEQGHSRSRTAQATIAFSSRIAIYD